MARKEKALLHIGPSPAGLDEANGALARHADLLDTVDLILPGIDAHLHDLAGHEMLADHKAAGLGRKDVEGSWAEVGRRATRAAARAKRDVVLSQPRFHTATDEQVELVLHALGGLDVHVVITPSNDEENDNAATVAATWARHLPSGRVLISSLADDAGAIDLAENLVGLALCLREAELDRRIAKLKKRRKVLRRRIELRDAS